MANLEPEFWDIGMPAEGARALVEMYGTRAGRVADQLVAQARSKGDDDSYRYWTAVRARIGKVLGSSDALDDPSQSEAVYDALRHVIIAGTFQPGEKFSVGQMASVLGANLACTQYALTIPHRSAWPLSVRGRKMRFSIAM